MSEIDDLIEQGWNEHTADPAGVASRLEAAIGRLAGATDKAAELIRLIEHVLIAHRADAAAMARCSDALAPFARDAASQAALDRARLAAALLRDETAAASDLKRAAVVGAHGTAACGRASRGELDAARRLMEAAAAHAESADDKDSARAIAAAWNNIASQLLDGARSPAADALMMDAARRSRAAWVRAGTWTNEERADYLLSRCAATTGDAQQALAHARSCLAICEANDADALERFFAHEVLGQAWRLHGDADAARRELDTLRALREQVEPDSRSWCDEPLARLANSLSSP
ncbi:MAG TPA: hypothetical protein VF169_03740 [Albitalea sp.]|uniref:hypothetical protein n=1 Tax=Piscinibacter sp. TaxID=1903157 RepID=UPI002ED14861